MAAGDPANELLLVVPVGDVDGLDAADPVDDLDAVDVWRGGELWALADVNGPSATIARAMNGMVNFMRTLSLFFSLAVARQVPRAPCLAATSRKVRASIRVLRRRSYLAAALAVNSYSTKSFLRW